MNWKAVFTLSYWNSSRLGLIVGLIGLILVVNPSLIHNEDLSFNSEIWLQSTLQPTQALIFLESGAHSINVDSVKSFKIESTDDAHYAVMKLAEIENPNRYIFVSLVDPTNNIRFVSSYTATSINQSVYSLKMHDITTDKHIKVKLPTFSGYDIEGIWHLNFWYC